MYRFISAADVRPEGWLRRQLEIQAAGLSGNLHKVWPDVRDSAWIGGDREGWERVPYWLDGFIPLAWLLRDEDLMAVADRYVNAIIARQQKDGWICPCSPEKRASYDVWACFLIGKVLTVYCEFTGSAQAEKALHDSMLCLYRLMCDGTVTLASWGKFRWFEGIIPLQYLYDKKKERWIREMARMLRRQGADWASFTEEWKVPVAHWQWHTHIVNIGMMFKYAAVTSKLLGEPQTRIEDRLWDVLEKYNGTAAGIFTGDECLGGIAANRGSELCSVAELMYSCELLYALTGKSVWADRLEKAAFNAFPATCSEDMWTHQYDQMANQIACEPFPGKSFFGTNGSEAHLFGLEPNYGCCTANFSQAWPKLAMSIFLRTKAGIRSAMMLPASMQAEIGGVHVTLRQESEYPFRNRCTYTVTADAPVRFTLEIRIPGWAESFTVNGVPASCGADRLYTEEREWSGTASLTVEPAAKPHLVRRPYGMYAAEYGALVFSLPRKENWARIEYARDGVERKFPYCDYTVSSDTPWEFGFASKDLTACEACGCDIPFSASFPRVTLKASLAPVRWGMEKDYLAVAARVPDSRKALGEAREMTLIPYGCARLRMTEMPAATR